MLVRSIPRHFYPGNNALNIFRTTGASRRKQLFERPFTPHDTLLCAVALQGLESLAIFCGQAEFPRVRSEYFQLLFKGITHPRKRDVARIEDAPVRVLLGL